MPAFSFGTGTRDHVADKIFISHDHEKKKKVSCSPGPVYIVPSTVGDAPSFTFGSEEQRGTAKAKYPDSSVDLCSSNVDSQKVKFHSTKGIHFGTESRMSVANAETVRNDPALAIGLESPGSVAYSPDDKMTAKQQPAYSFGPMYGKPGDKVRSARSKAAPGGTPRNVGPGSQAMPSSMGTQPSSVKKSNAQWSFGSDKRDVAGVDPPGRQLLDPSPELSSLGRQVVSGARSAPQCRFGTATRDHSAKTHLVITEMDRGPAANMPMVRHHFDLPLPAKPINKAGS